MEKVKLSIREWIKKNPKEFILLLAILLVGAFLRLNRIDEYMTFLGDEGRDAIVVRRLLVNFDPILIGPGTSIGNMYLGPLYYYMMAPALFLANYSPVGPAIQIALLGVATIFFVWFMAREWFPSTSSGQVNIAALLAAGLYAISPTIAIFSRSSWNPNIMPFFATLSIYSAWKIWKEKRWGWLFVLGISYAFVLQSHYLGLLLAPVIAVLWLLSYLKNGKFLRYSLISLIIFLGLMSPLVIFDARHGWRNFDAMRKFFIERQTTVSARPWNAIPNIYPLFEKINTRLLAGQDENARKVVTWFLLFAIAWLLLIKREKYDDKKLSAYIVLFLWLGFAVLGLGLYKQEIYDHYFGFFFPAPFILLGALSQELFGSSRITRVAVIAVFAYLIFVNLQNNALKHGPVKQLARSQEVADKILEEAEGERFNLAVLAERNYEDGYQYFLEMKGAGVVDIDAQKPETITEQLFAVCELPREKCDPTHSPKAEVANFGWSKVEDQWEVFGVTLYKLVHSR